MTNFTSGTFCVVADKNLSNHNRLTHAFIYSSTTPHLTSSISPGAAVFVFEDKHDGTWSHIMFDEQCWWIYGNLLKCV